MKKLIIVCDESTKKYGTFLAQLISNDDDKEGQVVGVKDGEVQAVVWNEKVYESNAMKISSDQYVVFIGSGKLAKEQRSHMKIYFNEFGMAYGWLGKSAALCVEENITKTNDYYEFYDFLKGYQPETVPVIEEGDIKAIEEIIEEVPSSEVIEEKVIEESKDKPKKPIVPFVKAGEVINKGLSPIKKAYKDSIDNMNSQVGGGNPVKQNIIVGKIKEQQYDCLVLAFYMKGLAAFLGM